MKNSFEPYRVSALTQVFDCEVDIFATRAVLRLCDCDLILVRWIGIIGYVRLRLSSASVPADAQPTAPDVNCASSGKYLSPFQIASSSLVQGQILITLFDISNVLVPHCTVSKASQVWKSTEPTRPPTCSAKLVKTCCPPSPPSAPDHLHLHLNHPPQTPRHRTSRRLASSHRPRRIPTVTKVEPRWNGSSRTIWQGLACP